ncbi:MAG: M42 family metallopeptidase [Anaerolineae bacterium]|nr:M42 family metallopeptidase [Anaerolineae bacterium]
MIALPEIPIAEVLVFLVDLLNTPSPTGDCEAAMQIVRRAVNGLPLSTASTRKGGLLLTWSGDNGHPKALTAHVDTLGAMVRRIKINGRLMFTQIGGYDPHAVEGESCTIVTASGISYRGTILPVKASVHIYGNEARELERVTENYEIRLDARTESDDETRALGIHVGDFVYLDPHVEQNRGFLRSRHLDDKAGVAAIYGALLAMHRAGLAPRSRLDILISNYEEVGHGGAFGIPHDTEELVTIDMAAAGEDQNSDEFSVGICAKDSGGPYHLGLRRHLEHLAQQHDIPYHLDIYPFYGSDGESAWRAGANLKVALIGPGVDASHAYERTHVDSLVATIQLILAYLLEPAKNA